ncbi:hypothetical protein H072_2096 [Dactylellina haptotyla CBS 200.50]|uniref:Ribosomal protein bL31m N-terminal domain-containing protein n=1 Tax=Dactylellina haptotyla (strain CBS 200.50) TaxID=1284197 RepID=S8ALY0_DACHA|nr:hypothetical protein H072_2096 [Dactylellina haptotyla CBS 200.50]
MSTVSLRPILRSTPSSALKSRPSALPSFTLTKTQHRTATEIRRPNRRYTFEQIVILSDGSSYKQLTTSPQGVFRSNKDVRNSILWNPTSESLANVEEDEAGRLKKFREKFGTGFDAARAKAEEAGDHAAVKGMTEFWEDGGLMQEGDVEVWDNAIDAKKQVTDEEAPAKAAEQQQPEESLFGLISGSYVAPTLTNYGRRAKRKGSHNPDLAPSEGGKGHGGKGKKK